MDVHVALLSHMGHVTESGQERGKILLFPLYSPFVCEWNVAKYTNGKGGGYLH